MKANSIAIAIPAYEASPWIGNVVARSRRQLDCCPELGAVLVIDDGSSDNTGELASEAGAEVVRHPENRGKGTALATAFEHLFERGFAAVVTLDADGQHLPEEIPKLLSAASLGGADLVLGTRAHLFDGMSTLRRWSNRLSSRAISFAAGKKLDDVQTGFRLYTKHLLQEIRFPGTRFEAESAVVVRAARGGFKIESVAVELGFADGRRTSHYRPLVDSLRIAQAVARARFSNGTLTAR